MTLFNIGRKGIFRTLWLIYQGDNWRGFDEKNQAY